MKSTRFAWAARWLMIFAIATFPAAVAAQTALPLPAGGHGEPSPSQGSPTTSDIDVLAASPATFGTTYVTVTSQAFFNFYTGTYESSSGGTLRWPLTGSVLFMAAAVELPMGVTVTEVEFYIRDNNGAADAAGFLYRSTPGTNTLTSLAVPPTSTGASTSIQTVVVNFTPFVIDSSTHQVILGFSTGNVGDGTLALAGARIGHTGAPGELIMFPAPDRFVDTRDGRGGKNTKYADLEAFDHTITGVAGLDGNVIPTGAKAILGNVVAVNPTRNGLFKVLPGGTSTTLGRASVNFNAGFNTGNAFTIRLDALGRVRGFHSSPGGTTDLIVDVVGYYR